MTPVHHRRLQLKIQLFQQIDRLEPEEAILPAEHPTIDQIICELETLNPIDQPLRPEHWPLLLGSWALVYASRGTVVTRRINRQFPLPVGIRRVWQRLNNPEGHSAEIATENGAVLSIPFFGELTATAQGIWKPYEEGESAQVSFGAFTVQATRLLGIAGLNLPQITVPVLEFLRQEALWITSYLDEDLRFGRGATGNLFVFRR
ncbi:PAP/fibrillin family protein [Leptolyngbya sp. CCNP1308]|uniref:PAP/fibrillin family protein n=1 Tax=Leptolyngbya sp. CCNP1308 TaxID=3110255 RepID=UPI002B213BB0|nr:PAP/fibrillin family protein [Leptolyngbya sp. CCNP1308]MEA5447823.1 PAP/fibrillin family protein [Leptolyngbya sp. CCNP1308]